MFASQYLEMFRFNVLTLAIFVLLVQTLNAGNNPQEENFMQDPNLKFDVETESENKVIKFLFDHAEDLKNWQIFFRKVGDTVSLTLDDPEGLKTIKHVWNEMDTMLQDEAFHDMVRFISGEIRETLRDQVARRSITSIANAIKAVLTTNLDVTFTTVEGFVNSHSTPEGKKALIVFLRGLRDLYRNPETMMLLKYLRNMNAPYIDETVQTLPNVQKASLRQRLQALAQQSTLSSSSTSI